MNREEVFLDGAETWKHLNLMSFSGTVQKRLGSSQVCGSVLACVCLRESVRESLV